MFPHRLPGLLLALVLLALAACGTDPATEAPPAPRLPPRHQGVDYQLGGAYPPPEGARIVVRDHTAKPAAGHYNVCYVNAFQAQPGRTADWPADLLLSDARGRAVIDRDWDERLLDLRTPDRRKRAAARVGREIAECARRGFQAVEPDNYDSYSRSHGLLTPGDATAYLTLLVRAAHRHGLAVAQKNTAELAAVRERVGLDFAVTEECGAYEECETYLRAFGGHVIDIEYTREGLRAACAVKDLRRAVVLRDLDLVPKGGKGYVRALCPASS
ncbi:endo alpha-1,4 polygalactosaminidase [Streptomyces sp. SPB074]|uniref:endo alpha-1,4 polygalactosaminidase n=1 Tax=Streptomyces sp. (strain SPB074) TaxID=465543 RepID=UPI00017F275E|nr:endo alpha-1,4 polygalactosaminidase [Streptomyces sp. SPB074]EDY43521.1 secreted protein [Streptomyces sp. SPB074]